MCGCRGNNKNPQSIRNNSGTTVVNKTINKVVSVNNPRPNVQQQSIIGAGGMTKEQRDVERKKRIQLVLKLRHQ